MSTEATAAVGWRIEDIDVDEMILNMGPQHPSTHGVLRLELRTDGEVVRAARPHIGYLHRCFEKHAESVDYPGVIPYTDRMDYVASMGNSLGYALAVENLLEIEITPYVNTIRVIMAELQRIASHCVAVGTYGMDIGAFTPFLHLLRDREKILDLFEWTCGARLLYNYNWIGGVSHDLPDGFIRACRQFLREFEAMTYPEMVDLLIKNKIFVKRTAAIGVCRSRSRSPTTSRARTSAAAASRATCARTRPTPATSSYEFDVPVGKGQFGPVGSCFDRNWVRAHGDGGERQDPPPGARPPREDGAHRRPREGAEARQAGEVRGLQPLRGAARPARLLHRGRRHGVNPYRVKVKSPCFTAMSVFHVLARGMYIADIIALIGSLDVVLGEIDR